jgi:hypothetical protein
MGTNIEIRRGDYTGGGIYRTSESTSMASLTGIKLQVDQIQVAINKEILQLSTIGGNVGGQRLTDLGRCSESLTLKGTITKDNTNNVRAVHFAKDFEYACLNWHTQTSIETLIWTDESDTSETFTFTGYPLRGTFSYTAGDLDIFPFTLQWVWGVKSTS